MVKMDNVENSIKDTQLNPNNEHVDQGKSSSVDSMALAYTSSSLPRSSTSVLPPPPALMSQDRIPNGPTPEKGSGQDRFRQMMTVAPKASDMALIRQLPSTMPFSFPMSVGDGSYYTPSLPAFHQDMYGEPDRGHRFAANAALFPTICAPTADISSSGQSSINNEPSTFMPMPNSASGYGNPSNHNSQRHYSQNREGTTATITWTSVLSAECQKRRFNPQFTEWITPDGHFRASVNLKGLVMHDSRNYKNAADAKQSLAKRAVEHVRKLEVPPGSSNKATERARLDHEVMSNRDRGGSRKSTFNKELPASRTGTRNGGTAAQDRCDEDRRLCERIKSLYGHSTGLNESILADPIASRAFLEGFALGGKLRESSSRRRGKEVRRSRSPSFDRHGNDRKSSPVASSSRAQRERSPPRRGSFEQH